MRLKASVVEQYSSVLHFWYNACGYKGTSESLRGRCCKPETKKYQQKCDNL